MMEGKKSKLGERTKKGITKGGKEGKQVEFKQRKSDPQLAIDYQIWYIKTFFKTLFMSMFPQNGGGLRIYKFFRQL